MPNISVTDKGVEPAALEDEDVAVDEQAFADAGDEEQWQQASGEDVWHS